MIERYRQGLLSKINTTWEVAQPGTSDSHYLPYVYSYGAWHIEGPSFDEKMIITCGSLLWKCLGIKSEVDGLKKFNLHRHVKLGIFHSCSTSEGYPHGPSFPTDW